MDPRGGNRRSRALSRSTGFAPTGTRRHAGRPAGRSVSRTRKAENAQFWAGSRQGNGATRRSLTSARCGPNWLPSPTLRLTIGRFSKSSGPTNGRSTFFMRISARFPTVASNWKYRAVLRDDVGGKVGDSLSPRQGDDGTGGSQARTRVFPQVQAPPTQASRPTAARSGVARQQGSGQPTHETGALEHEVKMSSPSLVGPSGVATGAANEAPDAA